MRNHFFRDLDDVTNQTLTGRFIDAIARDVHLPGSIKEAFDSGNWELLCNRSMAYRRCDSVSDIIGERQVLAFFAKNLAVPLGVDRAQLALAKFLESEQTCKQTNSRFRALRRTGHRDQYIESVLFTAQRKIALILGSSDEVLGSFPRLEDLRFEFGPGANTNVKKITSARWKLSSRPACSSNMTVILSELLSELPALTSFWCDSETEESWSISVDVMPGELMFVAKNAKIDRSIIVEPTLNTLVQKGIGKFLRERLLRFGINLADQSEGRNSNRRRAWRASIDDDLMTVDLSSASDTIATELVKQLLPFDWYELLSASRTSYVKHGRDGEPFELEKFSSMGNGFTFELESLIFYALTCAICEVEGIPPDVTVYGDDIIAPNVIYERLDYVFRECGFEINKEKSYVSGPFRESCGGDYFLGQDVRPYYQKKNWSWADLYSFHNFLVRKGVRYILPQLFEEVLNAIPTSIRNYGPDGYGDGHLIGDWQPKRFRSDRGWSGYVFTTRVKRSSEIRKYLIPGDYLLPFYSAMVGSGGGNHFAVRSFGRDVLREIRVYTLSRS